MSFLPLLLAAGPVQSIPPPPPDDDVITGAILPFAGPTVPAGYLLCYGQALNRTTYAALFAVIGTTYGSTAGDNFLAPDLRGRLPAGRDDMGGSNWGRLSDLGAAAITLGGVGGLQNHTLAASEIPAHKHPYNQLTLGDSTLVDTGAGPYTAGNFGIDVTDTLDNTGGGSSHNNIQPVLIVNYIIKF